MLIFGLVIVASQTGLLPTQFANLWPLMMIVVALAAILISDKEEWDTEDKKSARKPAIKKPTATRKSSSKKKTAKMKK